VTTPRGGLLGLSYLDPTAVALDGLGWRYRWTVPPVVGLVPTGHSDFPVTFTVFCWDMVYRYGDFPYH